MHPERLPRRPAASVLFYLGALAFATAGACSDRSPGAPVDGTGTDGTNLVDTAEQPDSSATADTSPVSPDGTSTADGTSPTPDTITPDTSDTTSPSACSPNPCTSPNRTRCVPTPGQTPAWQCACDDGFNLVGDACVDGTCGDEMATTGVTVMDLTPLANTSNPVRSGYDPLLAGDSVRVVVSFDRTAGTRDANLVITTGALTAHPTSFRLNGTAVVPTFVSDNRVAIALPPEIRGGHLFFEGAIATNGPGLLALEARLMTSAGCNILGSASGARIQLTGSINPKYNICNDLADIQSLQISAGIPDKDTSVYATRNGDFDDIASSFKVLTQMTLCLLRPEGYTVSLSGSADGTRPWTIDNHLLVEVFDGDPTVSGTQRIDAWVTTSAGATAPSRLTDGRTIRMLAQASLPGDYTGSRTPSPFTFPANTVQLNRLVPPGERVWLRLTGLDSGVAGHMSRLYLHVSPPETPVLECRSPRDCPRENAYNGDNTDMRSGCIAGRCVAVPCSAGAPCATGQLCVSGFCSDGCMRDDQCATDEVCGMGRCVKLAAGGCRSFADCPTGEVCFFGRCEAGCFHPVNQNPTYADNYVPYSLCKSSPAACPRCGDASSRCWYNYCRDCEMDAHCAAGQVCNNFKCETAP